MHSDKRLYFALAASVLLNASCVAMVGSAALSHHKPPLTRSIASLHPAALQMASLEQSAQTSPGDTSGQPSESSAGDAGLSPKPGSGQSQGEETGKSSEYKADYKLDYRLSKKEAAALTLKEKLEQRLNSGKPLSSSQKKLLTQIQQQLMRSAVRAIGVQQAVQQQAVQQQAVQQQAVQQQAVQRLSQKPNQTQMASSRMSVITKPSVPARNSHAGQPGNSISPKMVKYPKMKLDLGTIHMTRPKHGVTGGGSSDLRDVEIKVHYVVDDPSNVPKTLLPNRSIKMFASNCNGDPGNTARCLPTGGNTSLGGTKLHGRHDQISGVKYCIPGGGGIPGSPGGSSQSQAAQAAAQGHQGQTASGKNGQGKSGQGKEGQGKEYGKLAGSQQIISHPYPGSGPASPAQITGWHDGRRNPNEIVASTINALHLPGGPSDFRGMVPGAEVPLQDRKWVSDPEAHRAAAPPGVQTVPMPRFSVSPRSIGSMSRFGTVVWGRPVKVHPKKQHYGGDGSGLLGMYYLGNNFNQLVLTRPDRNIDYNWSSVSPDPRIARNAEYSVRWEGKLVPQVTDTYTLMTGADDGVRVYLDDRLIICNWTEHAPSEDTAKVALVAGHKYKIKVEYYENGYGLAAMKLYWESPLVPREYIPEQCLRYPRVN